MVLQMTRVHEIEDHAIQYILTDKELLWAFKSLFFKKSVFLKTLKQWTLV